VHEGELVVHKELVRARSLTIFKALFDHGTFPVEKMKVIDDYQGDDDASMADNNTSAFNCRLVAGKPGVYSKHSDGRAIDINPRTNPMVAGQRDLSLQPDLRSSIRKRKALWHLARRRPRR
jgi:hypothetical protein